MQLAKVVIASALVLAACAKGLPEGKQTFILLCIASALNPMFLPYCTLQLELCTGLRGVLTLRVEETV